MNLVIKCEVLKINTNEVFIYNKEVLKDSELYNLLQTTDNPITLGFIFSHNYVEPQEINNEDVN